MNTGFEDITDLLSDILGDDSKPAVPKNSTAPKKGVLTKHPPIPGGVKQAITEVAVETFDPELLDMANKLDEEDPPPLSSVAKKLVGGTASKPPKKVTQGVTTKAPSFKGKKASAASAAAVHIDDEREKNANSLSIPMPKFTSADLAQTMDIRNFATLVTLETARWHAKVKDRKASNAAAKANDADEAAFDTRKHLLVGADELLRRIHKALDEARAKHYEMTLPWTTKGVNDVGRRTGARLLPNTLFFEYTAEMAKWKGEMKAALDAFVPEYPNLIQIARQKLGKSFDAGEYPPASDIGRHFGLSFDFQPIPQGQDFKGLPDQQLDALARTVNGKAQQMMENAMQEVWTRLYQAVSHMAERLGSPDKAFHYTMVDNVREVTRLLKHLNVTQDVNVEKIRKMLDKYVTPHDAKELRDNSTLRVQVSGYAQSIVQAMNKLGGAKKT